MITELGDILLRYDGIIVADAADIPSLFFKGIDPAKIVVAETTDGVDEFNQNSDKTIKQFNNVPITLNLNWNIPDEYKSIDLEAYVKPLLSKLPEEHQDRGFDRIENELVEIRKRNLENFFRTIIFVLDRLKETKSVYGVGRGSSCACLFLYLIGLHKVNPIKYDIPMTEFFHD